MFRCKRSLVTQVMMWLDANGYLRRKTSVLAVSSYSKLKTKLPMNGTQDIFWFLQYFFFMLLQMSSISALCSRSNVLEARIDFTNRTIIQYAVKWSYALKHSRSILVFSGPPVARETSQVCVSVCICVSMSACICVYLYCMQLAASV